MSWLVRRESFELFDCGCFSLTTVDFATTYPYRRISEDRFAHCERHQKPANFAGGLTQQPLQGNLAFSMGARDKDEAHEADSNG